MTTDLFGLLPASDAILLNAEWKRWLQADTWESVYVNAHAAGLIWLIIEKNVQRHALVLNVSKHMNILNFGTQYI